MVLEEKYVFVFICEDISMLQEYFMMPVLTLELPFNRPLPRKPRLSDEWWKQRFNAIYSYMQSNLDDFFSQGKHIVEWCKQAYIYTYQ